MILCGVGPLYHAEILELNLNVTNSFTMDKENFEIYRNDV